MASPTQIQTQQQPSAQPVREANNAPDVAIYDAAGSLQDGPVSRFMPYHSPHHQPSKGRYITSNDPRGYIPVYEYPLNGQWIMMDMDDGYILWTGIWKALGNHKADIVKMLESQPELANQLRRVRGGYLKIQGTWLAYEVALRLARRVGWPIRHDLVPLFGPTFPTTCLAPDQPGYGTVIPPTGRRKPRRSLQSVGIPPPHSVPYPPRLPLVKELAYNVGHHQVESPARGTGASLSIRPPLPQVLVSSSPVDASAVPFAPPSVPAVPSLLPANGQAYSPQEPVGASQFNAGPTTYSPLREYPPKVRYSPYGLSRRHHSPCATISSFGAHGSHGSLGYEHYQRPLVHRASDPNLRSFHLRGQMSGPRLSLNTQQLLPARELKRPLPSLASAPESGEMAGRDAQQITATEEPAGEFVGTSSGDSNQSSIHTPPFQDASSGYDPAWRLVPTPVDGSALWPETPGEYATYDGSLHYTESAPSYSDPSTASPRTAWSSIDGYGHHSPSERHYQFHPTRPMHHHYSSVSSTTSFDDRRMSMADTVVGAFPEPEHTLYHRYSQPQLHQPLPPAHLDMWMRERSGSFAEPSYMPTHEQKYPEMVGEPQPVPAHEYTPSPQLADAQTFGHRRSSSMGSFNSETLPPSYISPEITHADSRTVQAW